MEHYKYFSVNFVYYLCLLCVYFKTKSVKFGLSITLLIFSITGLSAQNNTDAERVINNLLASVKTTAIKTNFVLSTTKKNAVTSQPVSGNFIMKGNKFMLDMDETKAWFDGKTQWTYMESDKEVSITEPTIDELAQINPMAILASFKAKSAIRIGKAKTANYQCIELIPKNKKDDFVKVEVHINKANKALEIIKMLDKKGTTTLLVLTNYQQVSKVTDDSFMFNKAKFKGVTINDLR